MRTNLAKDPSLRSGTTTAFTSVAGATLAVTTDYAFYGKNALMVTKDNVNGSGFRTTLPISVVAGLPYAFSIYGRIPVTIPLAEHASVVLQVQWLNSLGTTMQTDTSAVLEIDSDDSWFRVGGVWTAPVGATVAYVFVLQPMPGSEGALVIFDALLVEQAHYIGGFFENIPQTEKNAIVNKALSAVPQVVNGIRLGADIVLNDLVLNTIDEDDTVWVVTNLEGWWGQTNPDLPDISRGTEDGSYDVQGRYTARNITLSGFFIPKDPDESLTNSINRLISAIDLVRTGGWLHTHETPTKGAFVRLANKPNVETVNARGRTNFQVTLRAGDPIKYHWNDADPEGYTNLHFDAADVVGFAENIGTATVTGWLTLTGPAGAGTRIFNASTDETLTLKEPLRGAGMVADAYEVESTDGMATIRTTAPHHLRVGDEITLMNMVIPFSESDQTRVVTHVSDVFPYSFSFEIATDDVSPMSTSGQVFLVNNDMLEVDTYNRAVIFNGEASGHRHRLEILTDWIHFAPGDNIIEFADNITQTEAISKQLTSNVVTLKTEEPHYLKPGELIQVALPEDVPLSKKQLTSNVVTLTTAEPHGFSVGDTVDVASTETSKVVTKSRTSNVATLTTETPHGVSVSDTIEVHLPTTAVPSQKQLTSNSVTLTTQHPHGLSAGDSVTVALPVTATIVNKSLTNNQVTLTTSVPHNFAVGDSITVTMPSGASVTGKARSGSQVVITTSAAHGYSVGDQILVTFPTSATLTGNRATDGATYLFTYTTSAAHGFSVGDRVTIAVSNSTTAVVTNRVATSSDFTLTTSTNHGFVVGERITVTNMGSRYTGTWSIASVTSNTITVSSSGPAESSAASSGTIVNNTLVEYSNTNAVIETVPTTTTFTVRRWGYDATSGGTGTTGTVTNLTNQAYNGTKTLISVSSTTFTYNL